MKKKQNNKLRFNYYLIKKEQRNSKLSGEYIISILLFFFTVFLFLVYTLPDDVLTNYSRMREYVDFMAVFFPSVNGYINHSTFPQTASLIFSVGILLCILVTIHICYCVPKNFHINIINEIKNLIIGLIVTAFFIYMFLYDFPDIPGHPTGRRGKILSHVLDSRLIFCIVNTFIFCNYSAY